VAWRPLNWSPAWFAEIAPFPSAVLAHHYPDTPNLGDANTIHEKTEFKANEIDVLVAGTPCQSFSLQGSKKGIADPRGSLALRFLEIAEMRRPRWLLWENVESVLCANGGRDFDAFLRKLGNIGYGYSWRVLDARDFGLAQSRRRVFLVGHTGGDWQRAAAVFSERESLPAAAEPGGGTAAQGRRARAADAGAAYALQGNDIHRCGEAGRRRSIALREGLMYCLTVSDKHAVIADGVARYILPVEAERLQGLPDNYTNVAYRGMPASDQLRYEAVGNAIPVPILRRIGMGIAFVDALPSERVRHFLPPDDLVKTLSDAELVERCVQGFRKLREIASFLREARDRFAQPGRRVPVPGNPTWTEWVEQNLGVTVRRVQQLLSEPTEPSETISPSPTRQTQKLRSGDWRGLLTATERRTAEVFGQIEDAKELARAIRKYAQALADRHARPGGKLSVSVSLSTRK
jgi:DNA (cytosine-5)-methyltransferase 1